MTAATAIALDHSDLLALQRRQPINNLVRVKVKGLGTANAHNAMSPSVQTQSAPEGTLKSYNQSYRTFANNVAVALRRRVGTGTGLTVKQLAHAIGASEPTIWNLLNGNNDPSSRILIGLINFFDSSFASEIFEPIGCVVAKLSDRRAALVKQLNETQAQLKALDGA